MNELLLLVEILVMFSLVLVFYKLLGKQGLFAWIAIASVVANIQVAKQITIFGLDVTMGNVLFASTFLATDILNEKYSFKDSKKGVYIGLMSVLAFLLMSQFTIKAIPNSLDMVDSSMQSIFILSPRICISSVSMYFVANLIDVYLFDWLKSKFPNKLWLRNNISTILSNCLENFLFTLGAFIFVYSVKDCMLIAFNTCIIEVIIAICDTPFLYISKKLKGGSIKVD